MTHDCGSPLFFHWGCRFLEYSVDVSLLSSDFMVAYPGASYPELMCKQGRSYTCLLVDTHDEYLICIPFRSHIRHNNAYIFQNTQRSKHSRSGLDYTKVALIKDPKYIDQTANAIVDNDEFNELCKISRRLLRMSQSISTSTSSCRWVRCTASKSLRA